MDTEINIEDLKSLVQIIDVMAARGAIKGEEMAFVSSIRTKLVTTITESQNENTRAE